MTKIVSEQNTHATGIQIGALPAEKVAFHGAAPVVQGAHIANVTPAADGTTAGTAVNAILAVLRAKGIIASS